MEKYISKSALLAEIENWKQHTLKCGYAGQGEYEGGNKQGRLDTCEKFLSFLDNLETKEVDLERLINNYFTGWYFDSELDILAKPNNYSATVDDVKEIAKHFFELGIAANNKVQNIWHDANEKLPTGVIVVSNGGNLHIGWSTDEGDGIEDEHGRLITKTYQKWAREKDFKALKGE